MNTQSNVATPPSVVDELKHRFTYHAPKPGQPEKYVALREKSLELAKLVNELCPPSREASLALTNLEQCVFWANASIARWGQ